MRWRMDTPEALTTLTGALREAARELSGARVTRVAGSVSLTVSRA